MQWCTPRYFALHTGWSLEAVKLTLTGRRLLAGRPIEGAELGQEPDLAGAVERWRIPTSQISVHRRPNFPRRNP